MAPFVESLVHSLLKRIFLSTVILSVRLSQSNSFKELSKCSNEQLLSKSALYLTAISKISAKIQCLGILFQVLTKFISETFPKVAVSKRSPKGAMSRALYVERPVFNLLSAKHWQKCNL